MDKRKLNMAIKIDCFKIQQVLKTSHEIQKLKCITPTLEVHGDVKAFNTIQLDIRTYICAHGKCNLHFNRSHRRISDYNLKKIQRNNLDYNNYITEKASEVINSWILININNDQNNIRKHKKRNINVKKQIVMGCHYCLNPKLLGMKHTHFIRQTTTEINKTIKYKPIEEIFDSIDKKAENNTNTARIYEPFEAPGQRISQNNNIRMTYGDLNYIGSNKALLYFDRGIRGKQTYTNSMYPIEHQAKYQDIIVVDDIVFTSSCKCDSIKQHDRMFPHYRVTCAVGLTCPARLNNIERIIFARDRNASTERFTTARSMLVRYW